MELMERQQPTEHLNRFSLEFVWKAVTFDRMQDALRTFALDDESVSQYIFHKLLGHQVVPQTLNFPMPRRFSAPGLPELNHSHTSCQVCASDADGIDSGATGNWKNGDVSFDSVSSRKAIAKISTILEQHEK